jgi:riboflavin synthase
MKPLLTMKHFVAYHGTRRVEVDAYTFITAQLIAAELLDTKRVHDVQMYEDQEPKHNAQDLAKDTTEDTQ